MSKISQELIIKGSKAKEVVKSLALLNTQQKNDGLLSIAKGLESNVAFILEQNKIDVDKAIANGTKDSLIDRLRLTEARIKAMADATRQIIDLDDPIGEVIEKTIRPNGLEILTKRVPIGVVGIIYEARPNVTLDAATLTLKTSNAVILRGGSEAINSNKAIVKVICDALESVGISRDAVQLIEDTSREVAVEFMQLNDYLDLLLPRGGAGLIQTTIKNATVPVIETGVGNCHTFVDESADIDMAINICVNAKCSRPGVCNAMETLLVHKNIADSFLKRLKTELDKYNVEIRGCERTAKIIDVILATEEDFYTEFLDMILAIKVVDSVDQAIEHISKYGTLHSECIITQNDDNAQKFLNLVDAAAVYHNASTRFTDGFEFGFGAELGISTQKIHARGPMGLKALTSMKYIINGNGQVR